MDQMVFTNRRLMENFFINFTLFFSTNVSRLLRFLYIRIPISLGSKRNCTLRTIVITRNYFRLLSLFFNRSHPSRISHRNVIFRYVQCSTNFLRLRIHLSRQLSLSFLRNIFCHLVNRMSAKSNSRRTRYSRSRTLFTRVNLNGVTVEQCFRSFRSRRQKRNGRRNVSRRRMRNARRGHIIPKNRPVTNHARKQRRYHNSNSTKSSVTLFFPHIPSNANGPTTWNSRSVPSYQNDPNRRFVYQQNRQQGRGVGQDYRRNRTSLREWFSRKFTSGESIVYNRAMTYHCSATRRQKGRRNTSSSNSTIRIRTSTNSRSNRSWSSRIHTFSNNIKWSTLVSSFRQNQITFRVSWIVPTIRSFPPYLKYALSIECGLYLPTTDVLACHSKGPNQRSI